MSLAAAAPPAAPGAERYTLHGEWPALAGVAAWCAELARRHRLDPGTAHALDLCLSELVTNVIEHGGPVPIMIDASARAGTLDITLWDAAPPFDPLARDCAPPGTNLQDVRIGGLGIALVRRFARNLDYARVDGWNRLVFTPQGQAGA